MTVYRREAAFLTPSLIVFYVYIFMLTVVVSFLAPLFATERIHEVSNITETHARVYMRKQKGFLHKIEEETCFITLSRDNCVNDQKNETSLKYPTTIIIVQMSVCCPFVLVTVLCVYWEQRRCRNASTKLTTIVIICIKFESLHVLGYIFFPVFIGPDIGFIWNDLEFGYFIGIGNIVFVWIWLFIKIYTTKKAHSKRHYKHRLRKLDPVYIVDNFIFVEQHQNEGKSTLLTKPADKQTGTMTNSGSLNNISAEISDTTAEATRSSRQKTKNQKGSSTEELETTEEMTNENKHINAHECKVDLDPKTANVSFITGEAASKEQSENVKHLTEFTKANEAIANVQLPVVEEHQPTDTISTIVTVTVNDQHNVQALENESVERSCIKSLIEELWSPHLVGIGRDSHASRYSRISIKNIQHIHNECVWNHYIEKKKQIQTFATDYFRGKLFPPEEYGTGIHAVKTDEVLCHVVENTIRGKTDKDINEHYLFHGTDISNIPSISRNGFDKRGCHRTMLGKGVYFTDHPVKADQYTGSRGIDGDHTTCCIILARVLLGNSVITKERNADLMSATSPPCKVCLSVTCSHDDSNRFDSLIFDGGLFREYVVYENFMAYPEYVIFYDRVTN